MCVVCMCDGSRGDKEEVMASGEVHVDSLTCIAFAGMTGKMGKGRKRETMNAELLPSIKKKTY